MASVVTSVPLDWIVLTSKEPICAKRKNNSKIRTKLSAQAHLLITEQLMDINHSIWCVWCGVVLGVCVCVSVPEH